MSSRVPSIFLRNEFFQKLEIQFLLIKTTTSIKGIYYFFTRGIPRELGNSTESLATRGLRVPKLSGTLGNWPKSDQVAYCSDNGCLFWLNGLLECRLFSTICIKQEGGSDARRRLKDEVRL